MSGPFKVIFDQYIFVFIYNLAYVTKNEKKNKEKQTFMTIFNSDQRKNLRNFKII